MNADRASKITGKTMMRIWAQPQVFVEVDHQHMQPGEPELHAQSAKKFARRQCLAITMNEDGTMTAAVFAEDGTDEYLACQPKTSEPS